MYVLYRRHSGGVPRQGRAVQAVLARESRLRTHGMYVYMCIAYMICIVLVHAYTQCILRTLNSILSYTHSLCLYVYAICMIGCYIRRHHRALRRSRHIRQCKHATR